MTPASFEPPGFDATLGGVLLFEQIECHMSQDDKVLLTVVLAHTTSIFLKSNVEHPMQAIFDAQWLRTAAPKARASPGRPLYTPLGGSWLNMAELVQRIIVSRALAGQHPKNAQEIID